MKNTKKFLAVILALSIMSVFVPVAFAAPASFTSQASLQAALNAANPGESVDLSGAVSITQDLLIPAGVTLMSSDGTGKLDIINGTYSNAPIVLGASVDSANRTTLRGLKIVYTVASSWPKQVVYTTSLNYFTIDSCTLDCSAGAAQYILCLDGNPQAIVTNNKFIGQYTASHDVTWPLYMEGVANSPVSTLKLTGNTFTKCGQSALDYTYLDPSSNSTISGNIFDPTDSPLAYQFARLGAFPMGTDTTQNDYAAIIMNNYKVADASAYKAGDSLCHWMVDPIQIQDYSGFTNPVAVASGSFDNGGGTTQITYPFSYTFTAPVAVIKDPYRAERRIVNPAAPADVSLLTLYAIPGNVNMPLPSVPAIDTAALPIGAVVLDSTMGLEDAGGNLIGSWLITAVTNDCTTAKAATALVNTAYTDDFIVPTAINNDITSFANMTFALRLSYVDVPAAITKILQIPVGTSIPAATFRFTAAPASVDGNTSAAALATVPPLANLSVTYPGGTSVTSGDVTTVTKETGNIFAGVTFPHAGIYVYTITEDPGTYPKAITDPEHETMTYSDGVYTLTVYVANVPTPGSGTLYVAALGDMVKTADNGSQIADTKIDPTPGGNSDTNTGYSDMTFTNTYTHTNGPSDPTNDPQPADPNSATLSVSKTVTGDFADRSMYFNFNMTLSAPSLYPNAPASYRAYIVENGAVVTAAENGDVADSDAGGAYIAVANDGSTSFNLKDGQSLVFVDTPVGTAYKVTENASTANYFPNVVVMSNGDQILSTTNDQDTAGKAIDTDVQLVGENANSAAFTNEHVAVTPTGIRISDLPFMGLIVLAAASLAVFVAVKARKKKAYNR